MANSQDIEKPIVHHTINGEEFISMKSHREAMEAESARVLKLVNRQAADIAKKDAALKVCVEARKGIVVAGYLPGPHRIYCAIHDPVPDRCDCGADTRHPVVLLADLAPLDAAITQAERELK